MARKKKWVEPEESRKLREFVSTMEADVWSSPDAVAAIKKAKTRHEAIDKLLTDSVVDSMVGQPMDRIAFDDAFSAILSAYPVCTQWDYLAITQYAVSVKDADRKRIAKFKGEQTQKLSNTQDRIAKEDELLQTGYIAFLKANPKGLVKTFLAEYSDTHKTPINTLIPRLRRIRKKLGFID